MIQIQSADQVYVGRYIHSMPPWKCVRVEIRNSVGHVTLTRPDRLNAITHRLLVELHDAMEELGARNDVRAIVLAGAGRAFCAGLDLTVGLADPSLADPVEAMHAGMNAGAAVTRTMRAIPQPIIAAVQGHAVGAGFAFAVAADVRIVAPDTRFSAPFLRLGMTVGDFGLSWLLPRIIGHGRASQLFFSGGTLDAEQALAYGLAAHIAPDPKALATGLAEEIAEQPAYGVHASKRLLEAAMSSPLNDHLEAEARAQTIGALSTAAQTAMSNALNPRATPVT